jgi:hypothetical protein
VDVPACLYIGIEGMQKSKDVIDLSVVCVDKRAGPGVREGRDGLHCMFEVDGEWRAAKMFCLANIINIIHNHTCCLNERKTEDNINGNIQACGDKERGVGCILGVVRRMELKSHR